MLKYSNKKIIEVSNWDDLVENTYGKIYSFQQQDGCKDRGHFDITIPSEYINDDKMHESIPEVINGQQMGVKFDVWLARDINQSINGNNTEIYITLFWKRNFYPNIQILANDLYTKGLIEAGDYGINIDW